MSKIFIEPFHGEAFITLVDDLIAAGHQVIGPTEKILDYGFPQVCEWAEVKNKIGYTSLANIQTAGIDIIWCGCYEQCKSAVALGHRLKKPVILFASVNDLPYKDADSPYLISTDLITFKKAPIRHKLFYASSPDMIFAPPSPADAKRENRVISLIINHHQLWPDKYNIWMKIAALYGGLIQFDHHETLGRYEVAHHLKKTSALLHLKSAEGWGWSLAQAAISGCPVIVNGDLPVGRSCGLFLKHSINAWFLNVKDPVTDFANALNAIPNLLKDQGRYASSIFDRRKYIPELSRFITWISKDTGRTTPPYVNSLVPL